MFMWWLRSTNGDCRPPRTSLVSRSSRAISSRPGRVHQRHPNSPHFTSSVDRFDSTEVYETPWIQYVKSVRDVESESTNADAPEFGRDLLLYCAEYANVLFELSW